jgi:hypothetical protein
MKDKTLIKRILLIFSVLALMLLAGCDNAQTHSSTLLNTPPSIATVPPSASPTADPSIVKYSELFVMDELPPNYTRTTIAEINALIENQLTLPAFLPEGYEIKEVYDNSPSNILILISDQPIIWTGKQFTCRLILFIDWGGMGTGFKWLKGERQLLRETESVLVEEKDEYILWWDNFSVYSDEYIQKSALISLTASKNLDKETLIKIAESVPLVISTIKRIPAPPTTPIKKTIDSRFAPPIPTVSKK